MADTLLFYDDRFLQHDPGPGHPERADRLTSIRAEFAAHPISGVTCCAPAAAPVSCIERVHDPSYVRSVMALQGRCADLDPDTSVSAGSVDAAVFSAGAAVGAAEAVVRGHAANAFALVRPPGHHAERDRAMGFCLFNNLAIAVEHARNTLGMRRVLVVDWDVHHGNGTQHAFWHRRDVLVFNTHQAPLYPGTGAVQDVGVGEGEGFTVNVPLPAGCNDGDYDLVFHELLVPIADQFQPEIVFVSAGFDAHRADPIGGMDLTEDGFAALCAVVVDLAGRLASHRLVLVLEGGYDLCALARSVHACVQVLRGASAPAVRRGESRRVLDAMRAAASVQRAYWRLALG